MTYRYKDKDYFLAKLYALHMVMFALIGYSIPRTSFRVEPKRQKTFLSHMGK